MLTVLLALIGNLATDTVQIAAGWSWLLWLAVGLVGLATVVLTVRQQHRADDRRAVLLSAPGDRAGDPLAGRALYLVDSRLPKVCEIDLLQLRVKPAIGTFREDGRDLPPYVHRDVDTDLDWAITIGGLVLLHGRAASGKTRTAAEALRRLRPEYSLLIPTSGSALRELVESGYDLDDTVVWLDDLEQFLTPGGLDLELLQRLCPAGSARIAVLATIRDNELAAYDQARLTGAAGGVERGAVDLLAQVAGRRRLSVAQHLSPAERGNANAYRARDARIGCAVNADEGFAEYLAAGTAMMDYWSTGDGPLFHVGQAIISAAVDCRRAGYQQPLPAAVLAKLYDHYLPRGWRGRTDLPTPSAGITWASNIVLGASSCLQPRPDQTYLASDYLLDRAQNGTSPLGDARVPDEIWDTVLTLSAGTEAFPMLEGRLRFQATHDVLTGLCNRQRFVAGIEEALARKQVEAITLFHIDLDGFSAVNNGPGRQVGDKLLQVVASRLCLAFADETATIARLDADEFAVMIENTPSTPSSAAIANQINDELGEPVYVGDRGIAITACIAVFERPRADADPSELLQATDITLRRLKASGRRQWAVVDRDQGVRDRNRFNLAASIPGAWESGEIELEYQPLVSIDDRRIVAVQPLLRWDHPGQGVLEHGRCIEVLEETGLSLPIGRWMLSRGCEQIMFWMRRISADPPQLYVELTRQQAADPDLVSTVQAALRDTGMPNDQLRLGMPVQALCMLDGLAEDNLVILVDLGISFVLYEFGTTRGDIACLEDLPVHAIKMAKRVITRVTRAMEKETLFLRATRELIPLVLDTGAAVLVGHIESEDQLSWWRQVGAQTASGSLLGSAGPPEVIEQLLVASPQDLSRLGPVE